jgi:predicted nucleic acid-binding protein
MRVVDASIVLRWLLKEPAGPSARSLADHVAGTDILAAPELIHYEIANALATKTDLGDAAVLEAYSFFLDLGIETYSLGPEELSSSIRFARGYGITAYDASYLSLAVALGVRLLTGDARFARRAASSKLIDLA